MKQTQKTNTLANKGILIIETQHNMTEWISIFLEVWKIYKYSS